MARNLGRAAKRANKPNPREDRNTNYSSRKTRRNPEESSNDNYPKAKRVELLPRNVSQELYLEALDDHLNHIVFAMGPAGCGKTHLAVLWAIKQLQDGKVDKIVITRPQVTVDEDMGYLPGDILQKMTPMLIPIIDVFKTIYTVQQVKKMIENEIIELAPLGFMRGRTFKNAIVIGDEIQNATISQTKMLLTRIGEGSRMIITGDIGQSDRGRDCGLEDFVRRLRIRESDFMEVVEFRVGDIERHEVIEEVLKLYDMTI